MSSTIRILGSKRNVLEITPDFTEFNGHMKLECSINTKKRYEMSNKTSGYIVTYKYNGDRFSRIQYESTSSVPTQGDNGVVINERTPYVMEFMKELDRVTELEMMNYPDVFDMEKFSPKVKIGNPDSEDRKDDVMFIGVKPTFDKTYHTGSFIIKATKEYLMSNEELTESEYKRYKKLLDKAMKSSKFNPIQQFYSYKTKARGGKYVTNFCEKFEDIPEGKRFQLMDNDKLMEQLGSYTIIHNAFNLGKIVETKSQISVGTYHQTSILEQRTVMDDFELFGLNDTRDEDSFEDPLEIKTNDQEKSEGDDGF